MNCPSLMTRRWFTGGAVVAATALALPSLRAQPQPETPQIVIAVDGKAAFGHLPLTIADQLGYFRAEGLDIVIREFTNEAAVCSALQSGLAVVGAGFFEQTLQRQVGQQKFQAFVLQGRTPQVVLGVSSFTMPHYKEVADLKGKKIGVQTYGSPSQRMASLVLLQGGLTTGDVNLVAVGSGDGALAALRSGEIDAISNSDPVMTILEHGGDVKIISDSRALKGAMEIFGGPMPAACLYASTDFVQKNPNTCQALTNGIVHSLKWLQTAGPRDILQVVPCSYWLGGRALYLAAFNKARESMSLDGVFSDDGPRTALKILHRLDTSIETDHIDLATTYTNYFAYQAKARFKA